MIARFWSLTQTCDYKIQQIATASWGTEFGRHHNYLPEFSGNILVSSIDLKWRGKDESRAGKEPPCNRPLPKPDRQGKSQPPTPNGSGGDSAHIAIFVSPISFHQFFCDFVSPIVH